MATQTSINCISSMLEGAPAPGNCDAALDGLAAAYPYFVPGRYHTALRAYQADGLSPAILSGIKPYLGNWLLFCDFLTGQVVAAPAADSEPEPAVAEAVPEVVELPRELVQPAAVSVADEPVQEIIVAITATEINADEEAQEEELIVVEAEMISVEGGREELPEAAESVQLKEEEGLITPMVSLDYFLLKGEKIADEVPVELSSLKTVPQPEAEADKSLMVMMSFAEWLLHFKSVGEHQEEETRGQKALKAMWQKEKLAAAMEEENEEIPENVFKMAVDSITQEEGMASETLANIYIKQGKTGHAIDMYRKLSLLNPQKNTYFARKIEEALKNKET